jgi:hypothetical protein
MAETNRPRARTTIAAAILIFLVAAFFLTTGLDYLRMAIDVSNIDPERRLVMIGLGMNPDEAANFVKFFAGLVLFLCALAVFLGIGVLRRRENMRFGATALFGLFTVIWLPLTIGSVLGDNPPPDAKWQLLAAIADAAIVLLLLRRETAEDFEDAEVVRRRQKLERQDIRRSQRLEKRASRT